MEINMPRDALTRIKHQFCHKRWIRCDVASQGSTKTRPEDQSCYRSFLDIYQEAFEDSKAQNSNKNMLKCKKLSNVCCSISTRLTLPNYLLWLFIQSNTSPCIHCEIASGRYATMTPPNLQTPKIWVVSAENNAKESQQIIPTSSELIGIYIYIYSLIS